MKKPEGIDFVVIRENMEGLYPGREGDIERLAPLKLTDWVTGQVLDTSMKGKFAVRIITEENTQNIARAACDLALKRKNKGGKGKVPFPANTIFFCSPTGYSGRSLRKPRGSIRN